MAKEAAEAAARQKERDALQKPADEGETRGVEEPGNPAATSVENVGPADEDRQIESGTQNITNQHSSNDVINPDEGVGRIESKQAPEPTLTSYPTPYSTPRVGDEGGSEAGKTKSTSPKEGGLGVDEDPDYLLRIWFGCPNLCFKSTSTQSGMLESMCF